MPNVAHWYCTLQGREKDKFDKADLEGAPMVNTREAKISISFVSFLHADGGSVPDNRIRLKFLCALGLSSSEAKSRKYQDFWGPLDELRASHLIAGPFQVSLTQVPSEHLTFDDTHGSPTLRLLHLDRVLDYYIVQRSGLATYHSYFDS